MGSGCFQLSSCLVVVGLTWCDRRLVAGVENSLAGVDVDVGERTAIATLAERGLGKKGPDALLTQDCFTVAVGVVLEFVGDVGPHWG